MVEVECIELGNGVCRISDRRGAMAGFSESADRALALQWLGAAHDLAGIERLPEGVVVGCERRSDIRFTGEFPIGYDYQWAREVALDLLRGTTGLRIDCDARASLSASLNAVFQTRVRRAGDRLRLELSSVLGTSAGIGGKAVARVATEVRAGGIEAALTSALAGLNPIDWVRRLLAASGSPEWRAVAGDIGVGGAVLDELHIRWRELGVRAEAALWRALGDPAALAALRAAAEAIAGDRAAHPPVASPAEDWVASLGSSGARQSARNLLLLLGEEPVQDAANRLKEYAIEALDPSRPSLWATARLSEQAGFRPNEFETAVLIGRWRPLALAVIAKSREALNRKLAAELVATLEASSGDRTILDVSFPATRSGAARLRATASGGLDSALAAGPEVEIHNGWLAHSLARRRYVGLTLPFFGRTQYWHDLDALATADVVEDGLGRLSVFALNAKDKIVGRGLATSALVLTAAASARDGDPHCDNLTLAFEHRFRTTQGGCDPAWSRILQSYGLSHSSWPAANGEAVLNIVAPGGLVLSWTRTPHPSTPEFPAALRRVSLALQSMMRRWLPALHFADPKNYQDLGAAWPLLVYAASRPFDSQGRNRYAYDAMDPAAVSAAARSALPLLPALIAEARSRLASAGLRAKLRHYQPYGIEGIACDAIRRPQFASLLKADAFLIHDMVRIAETGRELRHQWQKDQRTIVRRLSRDSAYFVKSFHARLRRLYGGGQLLSLGSLVLVEATRALTGDDARLDIRLEWTGEDGARMFWTPQAS